MAKAILEFNLDESDDTRAFKRAAKSTDMANALHEIANNAKRRIEWELEGKPTLNALDAVDLVFERISGILDANNIDLDELIV